MAYTINSQINTSRVTDDNWKKAINGATITASGYSDVPDTIYTPAYSDTVHTNQIQFQAIKNAVNAIRTELTLRTNTSSGGGGGDVQSYCTTEVPANYTTAKIDSSASSAAKESYLDNVPFSNPANTTSSLGTSVYLDKDVYSVSNIPTLTNTGVTLGSTNYPSDIPYKDEYLKDNPSFEGQMNTLRSMWNKAAERHTNHSNHISHSTHASHDSHGTHSSHDSHSTHSSHDSHGSHSSHDSHSTHDSHGTHSTHDTHGSHGSHGTHSSHYAYTCCVVKGTLITINLNGDTKIVEDIKVGDTVLTYDIEKNILVESRVNSTISKYRNELVTIKSNRSTLIITPDHPVYTTNGWKAIDIDSAEANYISTVENSNVTLLTDKDTLIDDKGNKTTIDTLDCQFGLTDTIVYNFGVENYHCYFANGILIHNRQVC